MSQSVISTPTRSYLVSPDNPVPIELRFRVFVAGRPTDTAMKQPIAATVKVQDPGFDLTNVRWRKDNWFVIVGWIRWQLPSLLTMNSQLHIRMEAENYWPSNIVVPIPQPPAGQSPPMVRIPAVDTEMLHV